MDRTKKPGPPSGMLSETRTGEGQNCQVSANKKRGTFTQKGTGNVQGGLVVGVGGVGGVFGGGGGGGGGGVVGGGGGGWGGGGGGGGVWGVVCGGFEKKSMQGRGGGAID